LTKTERERAEQREEGAREKMIGKKEEEKKKRGERRSKTEENELKNYISCYSNMYFYMLV
jgi:hypothetical protein